MFTKKISGLLLAVLSLLEAGLGASTAFATDVAFHPNPSRRYVVSRGDTLWDIAGRFIQHPWQWREIWRANPQLQNPHLIYPGDVITLSYRKGRPELHLQRGHPTTVVLSPEVRATSLPRPIPTVPIDAIGPFLTQPLVVNQRELASAAYVVANSDGRLISAAGDKVYVRGLKGTGQTHFTGFRQGPPIKDPDSQQVLGYEAIYVADLETLDSGKHWGEVATLAARRSAMEIQPGDRVLPVPPDEIGQSFFPRAPARPVQGRIIAIPGGYSRAGHYGVVMVSLGQNDGVMAGDVLAVYQAGAVTRDPVIQASAALPDEYSGLVMLFRVFDRVSYGLVMQATRDMRLHDLVANPE